MARLAIETEAVPGVRHLPIVRTVVELRTELVRWRDRGETVGLVPTMGALHEGHLALVRRARDENRRVVATLFVNPTQFGPAEDLSAYPRDEAADRDTLQRIGVDLLYAPGIAVMYPPGFATVVTVSGLTDHLCGPHRPGHFAGVATVVAKLLLQAMPDAAYFGEKDFQQLQVIRRLARDLDMPARIVGVETAREPDGLAFSSRNRYLSPAERIVAAALNRVLRGLAGRVGQGKPCGAETAKAAVELERAGFTRIDYVTVADAETLQPVERVERPARAFAAVWLGRTRLIDNVPAQ